MQEQKISKVNQTGIVVTTVTTIGKPRADKERLVVLKNELSFLEKAISECQYAEPRQLLELQKLITLEALCNNAVYLDPDWLMENEKALRASFSAAEKKLGKNTSGNFQMCFFLAKKMSNERKTTFMQRFIALPFYEQVKNSKHLSTEKDFIEQTNGLCDQLQQANRASIDYAIKYSDYKQKISSFSERNNETCRILSADLKALSSKTSENNEEEYDEEVEQCFSKAFTSSIDSEEDSEDEEMREVLNRGQLSLTESFLSPMEELQEESSTFTP